MTDSDCEKYSSEYVSLRDYIDVRFTALEKATEQARELMEKRLDGMNEFRDTLRDQGTSFLTKAEYSIFKETVEKDLRILREWRSELTGKASQQSVNILMLISVGGFIMSVISFILQFIK
jgi:hypothetical protein